MLMVTVGNESVYVAVFILNEVSTRSLFSFQSEINEQTDRPVPYFGHAAFHLCVVII
jgi:hypothetical protein